MSRRSLLANGLIGVTACASYALPSIRNPQIRAYPLDQRVPLNFGTYQLAPEVAPVIPDADEQLAVSRAYENTLVRAYRAPDGTLIMLVIGHGRPDSGMLAIHRPEICYSAQGFIVTPMGPQSLGHQFDQVIAQRLFAQNGERMEPVLYWAIVAREQTDLGIAQKLRMLKVALSGQPTDSFLVRISTIGPNTPESFDHLSRFGRDLLKALDAETRADLSGVAA
jgi:EpsI family protein